MGAAYRYDLYSLAFAALLFTKSASAGPDLLFTCARSGLERIPENLRGPLGLMIKLKFTHLHYAIIYLQYINICLLYKAF